MQDLQSLSADCGEILRSDQ